eukprot:m.158812 g.158812  ORF g.158812 m.158812 type:complete len:618 (+) comp38748_c0_seq1:56-1909(+)
MGVFQNIAGFTAFLALASFSQSLFINGFYPTSVTSLERQFHLSSSQSGFVASMYDLSCAVFGVFVGVAGRKSHKPRAIALGIFILALASLLFALPKAFVGRYVSFKNSTPLCGDGQDSNVRDSCSEKTLAGSWAVFLISMVLSGLGATMLYVLSAVYLSDNTAKKSFPLYLGIQYTAVFLGTAAGFLLGGGLFINRYVDLGQKPAYLNPSHPAWVGAWWLEYLVAGVLLAIAGIPLLFFPKEIKRDETDTKSNDSESGHGKNKRSKEKIKVFGKRLGHLLCNPVLMFNLAGFFVTGIAVGGGTTFLPKFLQEQFSLAASTASLTGGAVLVPAAAIGCLTGGLLAHKMKFTGKDSAKALLITTCLSAVFVCGFLLVCKPTPVVGSEETAYNETGSIKNNLTSPCNAQCYCKSDVYQPTCGEDGLTYFSHCHAGCKKKLSETDKSYYVDCSCIAAFGTTETGIAFQASEGRCKQENCPYFVPFLLLFFLLIFFIFVGSTLQTNVVVRSVAKEDKTLALGLFQIFSHGGYVLGPVFIGLILDSSCIMWDDSCGNKGGCWTYETRNMGHYLFAMLISGAAISIVCFAISWWKFTPEMDEDDEESKEEKTDLKGHEMETISQ